MARSPKLEQTLAAASLQVLNRAEFFFRPRANALTAFDRKPGARSMTWKEREMYES